MNKIHKIISAVGALCLLTTSISVPAMAEDTSKKQLYLYEDMEQLDISKASKNVGVFGHGANVFKQLGKVKQYTLEKKASTSDDFYEIRNDLNGNKFLKMGDDTEYATANKNGIFTFRFNDVNSDGIFADGWKINSESNDSFVVGYDFSLLSHNDSLVACGEDGKGCSAPNILGAINMFDKNNEYKGLPHFNAGLRVAKVVDSESNPIGYAYGYSVGNYTSNQLFNKPVHRDLALGEKVRVLFHFNSDGTYTAELCKNDGTKSSYTSSGTNNNYTVDNFLSALIFNILQGVTVGIDNIKAYTVPNNSKLEIVSSGKSDIALNDSLDVTVNGYLLENEISKIVVKQNGVVVDAYKYNVSVSENKENVESTISVKFNDKMSFDSTYSVVLPEGFGDEVGNVVPEESSVDFTTIKAPTLNIKLTPSVNGSVIANIADAAGKSVVCDLYITNTTNYNSYSMIFVGLYDKDGNIVSYGSAEKAYVPKETDSIKVSLNIPQSTEGMQIKAFACEGIGKLDSIFSSVQILQ